MGSNCFGNLLQFTTWGESHGPAIGVVIDGAPSGIQFSEEDIQKELNKRMPGKTPWTSPRKEPDQAQILSGVFKGITTGTPISILIENKCVDSDPYHAVNHLFKPGHAGFTYFKKYGNFDYRGGGRASARETACRVAAGALAKKILSDQKITFLTFLQKIGTVQGFDLSDASVETTRSHTTSSPIFAPSAECEKQWIQHIESILKQGNSVGGYVEGWIEGLPVGLGDPIYQKIEANLAHAMLSIPASKAFEIGEGVKAGEMLGSDHNDPFISGKIPLASNHAGGTLGGITTGAPLRFRVTFKPTSSIQIPQETVDLEGNKACFKLPEGSKHDPCVAIRAVPVVEAMAAWVIADALLLQSRVSHCSIS